MGTDVKFAVANNILPSGNLASTGALELFWLTSGGNVGHIFQTTAGGTFSSESALGGTHHHGFNALAVGQSASGSLELFAVTGAGSLYNLSQGTPGDSTSWGPTWIPIGSGENVHWPQLTKFFKLPELIARPQFPGLDINGHIELFVNGGEWQLAQTSSGWSGWTPSGPGNVLPTAVAQNMDGTLELLVMQDDGAVQCNRQTLPVTDSTWMLDPNSWNTILFPADIGSTGISQLEVGINGTDTQPDRQPGSLELFCVDSGRVSHIWETSAGDDGSWTSLASGGWNRLGTTNRHIQQIAVGQEMDGRLTVFGISGGGSPWQISQLPPTSGAGWMSDWAPLGTVPHGFNLGYIVVGLNFSNGTLEVFSRGSGGHSGYSVTQNSSGAFGTWSQLF